MFFKNYMIALMGLLGMYVALDMVFNFSNITQMQDLKIHLTLWQQLYNIGDFYFFNSFLYFTQLSGMIAVVAAAFTVMRLSRYNEMTALLAAGVPLLRVTATVLLTGIVLNLVLLPIDQELVIPRLIPKLTRNHGEVNLSHGKSFPVQMLPDSSNTLFNAGLFTPATPGNPAQVYYLDVIECDSSAYPQRHITASSAVWNASAGGWDLTDGMSVPVTPPGATHPQPATEISSYKTDFSPDEIQLNLGGDYIQLLPTAKIDLLLNRQARVGAIFLIRLKYQRFTQPILNVIMLMLAISTVLTREPGTLKTSALRCMLLTGGCMTASFVTFQLAGSPAAFAYPALPALLAWLPIFVFGPLSVHLLQHVRT
jgi:lipopolysaccharide export LptBFGC system permease protein LptF